MLTANDASRCVEHTHHLHLLPGQPTLFVEGDVGLRAIQDHLVAAHLLGCLSEGLYEPVGEPAIVAMLLLAMTLHGHRLAQISPS